MRKNTNGYRNYQIVYKFEILRNSFDLVDLYTNGKVIFTQVKELENI